MLLQKLLKTAAKFSFPPGNANVLALVIAWASKRASCTKAHVSAREKIEFSAEKVGVLTH